MNEFDEYSKDKRDWLFKNLSKNLKEEGKSPPMMFRLGRLK